MDMDHVQPLAELRALFRNHPAFRRVFLADVASQFGDGGLMIAFPMLILEQTHDVSLTGLSFSTEVIAFALLSPLAGWVADRLEQKRVMLAAQLFRIGLLGLLLLVLHRHLPVTVLLGVSLALGGEGAFFMPARAAFLRRLLDGEELKQAIALEGTLAFLMRIVSQPVMGVLLSLFSASVAVKVDMASYAVAFALLLPSWVRGHLPRVADEVEAAWTEGWKTILRSGVLRNLLVLDTLLCLIGMAAFSITIAFLEQDLHLAPQANGWLLATTGLFGAVGTQLGGRLVNRQRVYIVGTFMIAVSYLLVPHATTLPLLLAMWSLRGVAIGVLGVLINQRLAEEVSGAVMGRVNAAWSLAACLAAFVGGASTPWLIRTIGPAQAYTLFGVLLVLVAALFGAVELGRLVRPKVRVDLAA